MRITNITRLAAVLFTGSLIFSSCAKKEYHGFFAPSNERTYANTPSSENNKAVAPEIENVSPVVVEDIAPAKATASAEATAPAAVKVAPTEDVVAPTVTAEAREAKVAAFREYYRSLDRKEKKELRKTVKQQMKAQKSETGTAIESEVSLILLVILAIFLPPVAVGIVDGFGSTPFWLDLVLTLLFIIPGMIYAFIRILR